MSKAKKADTSASGKMKIKCEECGTLLINPPLTTQKIQSMQIINYEKNYIKEREEVIGRFFAMYSKEINLIKKLENKVIEDYLNRLKSFNDEKHKISQKNMLKISLIKFINLSRVDSSLFLSVSP